MINPMRFLGLATLALALSAAAGASAASAETLMLDTHEVTSASDHFAGPVSTQQALDPSRLYTVDIQGTFSTWPASKWLQNGACDGGSTNTLPMFPSNGVTNGTVGQDAEGTFRTPVGAGTCPAGPSHFDHMQMDFGTGWRYQTPIGGPYVPTVAGKHVYRHLLPGGGIAGAFQFAFQLRDGGSLADNYGQLKITVKPVKQGCEETYKAYAAGANERTLRSNVYKKTRDTFRAARAAYRSGGSQAAMDSANTTMNVARARFVAARAAAADKRSANLACLG
ncbi:MAG: hypothetical protein QOF58_5736 [Pseudonocardiales bacterium]|jgi:hypothetical protein|nr:hypothetical protein [Pseudonocardiales bacterium]